MQPHLIPFHYDSEIDFPTLLAVCVLPTPPSTLSIPNSQFHTCHHHHHHHHEYSFSLHSSIFISYRFFPPDHHDRYIQNVPRVHSIPSQRLLYLSGDSKASGSPLLSRLDEKKPAADVLMNMGLANDLLLRLDDPPPPPDVDPPNLTLDSDIG